MDKEHPNIEVLKRLDLTNLAASAEVIAEDFVWHYYNPKLPDVQGDYVGLKGLQTFFETIGKRMKGTFKVNPVSITPMGDEFVVVHVIDTMVLEDRKMELDAVVVWRIVDGKIAEAWDIPGVNTVREVEHEAKK
ncbi:nuclear transport factor 2 family protein [Maribacter halichondriae]|uniref:nuclear transport factor 2 family protein n=1 Tax=Maribacter halichondriae TaxID=2980554 RepID=UPI0023599A93|nr:nuclear transport factor 2 family protein [Maribacter sp. Hal144]